MFRTDEQHIACSDCPIAKAADLMGDSTILLIIRDLRSAPKRFSELTASLPKVSTRTLTNKLRKLEADDIVDRVQYKKFPPHTEYRLTKKGRGFSPVITAMKKYGEMYL